MSPAAKSEYAGRRQKKREEYIAGKGASPGVAIGKAFVIQHGLPTVPLIRLDDSEIESEIERFHQALEETRAQLQEIKSGLARKLSDQAPRIFDAHLLMIEDVMAVEQTEKRIRENKVGAEQAFASTILGIIDAIESQLQDHYLRERLDDIRDVERRVLANLMGYGDISKISLQEKSILIAHDLTPSQTAQLDRNLILGCATDVGGTTSHTAILSRSLEIPSVVGLRNISEIVKSGDEVIVDGFAGAVIVNPSKETVENFKSKLSQHRDLESKLELLRTMPANTVDGRFIELSANIEFPDELDSVISHGAKGVGLFRTEFLYLTRSTLPTEQEQYNTYAEVARRLAPDPVIIRTLDAGADKFSTLFQSSQDPNPFLGNRAIRICLANKDIFRTQLRALFRSTTHGNVKILLPFISTIEELKKAMAFIRKVRREMEEEQIPIAENVAVGIMIEVPSAAMMIDEFLPYVDFISIGTNDLIQYVMAADRGNEKVAHLYQPMNPAVIRLINSVITAAKRQDKWVGVCGEMAGYPTSALLLVGLGVDELSTASSSIPGIKKIIRSISYVYARQCAEKVLTMNSVGRITNYLKGVVDDIDHSLTDLYREQD